LDDNGNVVYEHKTGDILVDGSGEEVFTTVVIHEPYCLESEISIIDI